MKKLILILTIVFVQPSQSKETKTKVIKLDFTKQVLVFEPLIIKGSIKK